MLDSSTWEIRYARCIVKLVRQLGVLVILLGLCLAPTMACVVLNAQMTADESACCRMMHGQCQQMEMPASYGCCQKTQPSVFAAVLYREAGTSASHATPVTWAAVSDRVHRIPTPTGW